MKLESQHPALTYILPKQVMAISGLRSYRGAWARIKKIKECLGKKQHQRLTVQEYAEWEGLDPHLIQQHLSC